MTTNQRRLALALLLSTVSLLGLWSSASAVVCKLTTVEMSCDENGCHKYMFSTSGSSGVCGPFSIKVERRPCGGGDWTTLTTNAGSTFVDCTAGSFDYRFTLTCAGCPAIPDYSFSTCVNCPE
jgi:hypothetical protein